MREKKRAFIISGFIIGLILYLFSAVSPILYANSGNTGSEIIIISHRGAAGLAPENTLLAIGKGLEFKADRIEIDVQQTKDSVVILMHDKTIDRTTNGEGKVKDLSYKEILLHNENIPTLSEAIDLIYGKSKLLIEIKYGEDYYPGMEQRVIDIINKKNARDMCFIQSFDDKVLKKVHELDSSISLQKLFIMKLPFIPVFIDKSINFTSLKSYDYVDEINFSYVFTTKRLVKKIHKLGKKINVWTIRDQKKIQKLKKLGVDGIITDYPNIAVM